jgi:hypothetical protein
MGAFGAPHGFSEISQGQHSSISPSANTIQKQDVNVAVEGAVLKSVI